MLIDPFYMYEKLTKFLIENEYSIILIILGYYYCGSSKLCINSITSVSIAYVLLNFLYGGRATGIQIMLCLVLCIWANRINNKVLFMGALAVFFFMTLLGMMRANWSMDSAALSKVYSRLLDDKFTNDTSYSAYHTSLTFLNYLEVVDWRGRFALFLRFLLSIFVGGSMPNSNLSVITREFYVHSYGGVLPFYMYFYLGYVGLLLVSIYLFGVMKKAIKSSNIHNGLGRCVGIYIASTSLRWYIYSPFQITRGVMLMVIFFYLLRLTDSIFRRKKYYDDN